MTTRDRMLRGNVVGFGLGPIKVPDRASMVTALCAVAAYGAHTRIGFGFDPDGTHWTFDPEALEEWCSEMVTSVAPATAETVPLVVSLHLSLLDSAHPLRLLIAGDYLIVVTDHALGDPDFIVDAIAEVLSVAAGTAKISNWLHANHHRAPLPAAARNTFFRRSEAISTARPRRSARIAGHTSDPVTCPRVRWHAEPAAAAASGPLAALEAVRGGSGEGASACTAALVVVLRRALRASGIGLHPDSTVVHDLRRYLPPGGRVAGNFRSTVALHAPDPNDITQVGRALELQRSTGRPLGALFLAVSKELVLGRRMRRPREVSVRPRARLIVSDLGADTALDGLRWTVMAERRSVAFLGNPSGPEDIHVVVVVIANVVHATASFHGNVFDEHLVQEAMRRAMNDPLSLVEQHAGG